MKDHRILAYAYGNFSYIYIVNKRGKLMIVIDVFGIMMFIGIIFIIGIAIVTLDELLKWITRKTDMLIFKIKNYRTPYLARITNELSLKDEIEFNNNLIKKLKKTKRSS